MDSTESSKPSPKLEYNLETKRLRDIVMSRTMYVTACYFVVAIYMIAVTVYIIQGIIGWPGYNVAVLLCLLVGLAGVCVGTLIARLNLTSADINLTEHFHSRRNQ